MIKIRGFFTSLLGGVSAPVTFAGNLVMCNAEVLSGIVIAQLKKKGAPCVYGGIPGPIDMRTMIFPYGSPEVHLLCAALADMAHHYKLPMFGTAGCSDAKFINSQAGVEFTWSILMASLSGANLVHDVGLLANGDITSPEAIVLADEIINGVRPILKGIEVSDETLALETINRVGPGGQYLVEEHTLKHFKKHWYPQLLDRTRLERIATAKKVSLENRVNDKVKRIIQEYSPEPLAGEVLRELANMEKRWLSLCRDS